MKGHQMLGYSMGISLNPRVECQGLGHALEGTTEVRLKHGYIIEPAGGVPMAGGCAGRENKG